MGQVITIFKENKEFAPKKHWDANEFWFPTKLLTPPHYADTIEMIISHGASGKIYIDGACYELSDEVAFFIPPNAVHAMEYRKSEGYVSVLKINHILLKRILDLEAMIAACGHEFHDLAYAVKNTTAVRKLESVLFKSGSLFEILSAMIDFFQYLCEESGCGQKKSAPGEGADLRRLIEWTEKNFMHNPTLSEAAAILGYNKNYFCRKFKEATGVTYLGYLNSVRIGFACEELKKGRSAAEVCYACGFTNPSYFIKLFGKIVGTTPMKYAAKYVMNAKNLY